MSKDFKNVLISFSSVFIVLIYGVTLHNGREEHESRMVAEKQIVLLEGRITALENDVTYEQKLRKDAEIKYLKRLNEEERLAAEEARRIEQENLAAKQAEMERVAAEKAAAEKTAATAHAAAQATVKDKKKSSKKSKAS